MEQLKFRGDIFYVDEHTRTLSRRFQIGKYQGPFGTLDDHCTETAMAKFMFMAKLVGQFVGADFALYRKEFPGLQWYEDPSTTVYSVESLSQYMDSARSAIGGPALRVVQVDSKQIFVPTEYLIGAMMRGHGHSPHAQHTMFRRMKN